MSFELLNARVIDDFDTETDLTEQAQCDVCKKMSLAICIDNCLICFALYGDERMRCFDCMVAHIHLPGDAARAASALMGDA